MANNRKDYNRPNFWGMIQNILIASMNKGQFILGIIGITIIIFVLKIPPEDSTKLLNSIIQKFEEWKYVGWSLGIFSTTGWYLGTKKIRKIHSEEMNRISEEKKQLQQKLTTKKIRSSNNS